MTPGTLSSTVDLIKSIYNEEIIPLHRPIFDDNEKAQLLECIDSNFVSSVGSKVDDFENQIAEFTGSRFAIATVNGTSALHIALQVAGVRENEEVITQALTFIATCNSISYIGAKPIFVDVDKDTMGMSPDALEIFLKENAVIRGGLAWNKVTEKRIAACVPMHTYGFPCRIERIAKICSDWGIKLIEDAAESLGSFVGAKHSGRFGICGVISFNGNKIITTGGGGMIITDDELIAKRAKHLTTTAKIKHPYEFIHDEIGYNYRLPNLNAALGCAQMKKLPNILKKKYEVAMLYKKFFEKNNINFVTSFKDNKANYWLNTVVLSDKSNQENFIQFTNANKINTRPVWHLMSELKMFSDCQNDGLENSKWLSERIVNLPSSAPDLTTLGNRKSIY